MSSFHAHAFAALKQGEPLSSFEYSLAELGPEQVDVRVESCGVCHSDLSMIQNEWMMSQYPLVPGHEVVGTIVAAGSQVKSLKVGQRVGIGWFTRSCLHCRSCLSGDQNLCGKAEQTIVGRFGGFADRIRCGAEWAVPLPQGLDAGESGPLFCGGITVFSPLVHFDVRPTHRVGVIGIGGLGHLALQFLNKWGCEVTAFSSTPGKAAEAKRMGAHEFVDSSSETRLRALTGRFDFILNTTNADLNWPVYLEALAPRGRLHTVGMLPRPIAAPSHLLIGGQKSVSGSPLGSPATVQAMLDFCARHRIVPVTEHFPMKDVNKALDHLRAGKARYRVVLDS